MVDAVRRRRDHRDGAELRDGAAVAELHRHIRGVFGFGFAIEGFSFFMEAIFIGIYVYGWGRLSPRTHFLCGDPDRDHGLHRVADGDRRQRLDEPPGRVPPASAARSCTSIRSRRCSRTRYLWHELIHMYVAGYIVTGFVLAAAYAFGRLRGQLGPLQRAALTIPLTIAALRLDRPGAGRRLGGARRRHDPADQARGDRGALQDDARARPSTCSAGTPTARSSTGSRSRTCCRCWPSTAGTRP